ncbi:MAG: hypothetical protein L3J82_09465 [Planctomycetes bacterium]|nr:hypothetical protein [Planctomycetota bacterium]
MADRDLKVKDFLKLYRAHGCEANINSNNFVRVSYTKDGKLWHFSQHAHKGLRDVFGKRVLRRSRLKLDFKNMPDSEFYAPLD